MPTKILYIVGTGSKYCDAELRWSLRSLHKYALDDVEPVIVGNVPDWFKGDALPCGDKFERKEMNLNYKITKAIASGLVNGTFQISADDHFWIQQTIFKDLPVYYRDGLLPKTIEKTMNNYQKALVYTGKLLHAQGLTAYNTCCHCNAWCDSAAFDAALSLFARAKRDDPDGSGKFGVAAWALWPNMFIDGTHNAKPIVERRDLKYRGQDYFNVFILGADMFSINDLAFGNDDFIHFMKANFDKPSRWEK